MTVKEQLKSIVRSTGYEIRRQHPDLVQFMRSRSVNLVLDVGANEGPAVYALDRAKMLVAQPATLQRKTVPALSGLDFQMLLPASINGTTAPPTGAPGIFARDNADRSVRG